MKHVKGEKTEKIKLEHKTMAEIYLNISIMITNTNWLNFCGIHIGKIRNISY